MRSAPSTDPLPDAVQGVACKILILLTKDHSPFQSGAPDRFRVTIPCHCNPLVGQLPGNSTFKSTSGHSTLPCPVASKLPVSRNSLTLPDQSMPFVRNATCGASTPFPSFVFHPEARVALNLKRLIAER